MLLEKIIGSEAYNSLSEEIKNKYGKANFEDVSGGKYVPKSRLDTEIEKTNQYKEQVSELSSQLTSIKEEFKDAKGLQEKVETLEKDLQDKTAQFEKQMAEKSFNYALDRALEQYQVKDSISVMAHINRDNLKLDSDGKNIIGLKEQIEGLKKSHDYLFETEIKGTGSFGTGYKGDPKPNTQTENIATRLGKARQEQTSGKSVADFFA